MEFLPEDPKKRVITVVAAVILIAAAGVAVYMSIGGKGPGETDPVQQAIQESGGVAPTGGGPRGVAPPKSK